MSEPEISQLGPRSVLTGKEESQAIYCFRPDEGAGHRGTRARLKDYWDFFISEKPRPWFPGDNSTVPSTNAMDPSIKRKKGVNWTLQENELVIELFLDNYDTYYFKFSDGSKKGIKAVRDSLHERWAEQLTRLGFSERSPAQVAEKIKKSIIITRKYINNYSENAPRTGRGDDLPPFLRPLEKKLREEHAKEVNGCSFSAGERQFRDFFLSFFVQFDLRIAEDGVIPFYDLLKDVKEESMSSTGGKDTSDCHSLDADLDIERGTSSLYESPMTRLSQMANIPQTFDPPIAPVTPFKISTLPSLICKSKKRWSDEEMDDMTLKRQRLLDAELELVERKRYLVEMKIKYWEEKTKRLSTSTS
ncbi:hypothetical protein COOONC_23082 [Cooperia oncophora]